MTITAAPGKGSEPAEAYKARCADAMTEPGCELNTTRPPLRPELRLGSGEREDYQYNRTQ